MLTLEGIYRFLLKVTSEEASIQQASVQQSSSSSPSNSSNLISVSINVSDDTTPLKNAARYAYALHLQARRVDGTGIMLLGGPDIRSVVAKDRKGNVIKNNEHLHQNFMSTFVMPNTGVHKEERAKYKMQTPGQGKNLVEATIMAINGKEIVGLDIDGKDNSGHGAILNDLKWMAYLRAFGGGGLVINDAWLLGGVDVKKDFYLMLSPFKPEHIWEEKEKRPTVFGRELLGLILFGYKLRLMIDRSKGTMVQMYMFPPPHIDIGDESLVRYDEYVAGFSTLMDVIRAIHKVCLEHDVSAAPGFAASS